MTEIKKRVLSGMRPTGLLHLGHYHGVLKNWLALQQAYDSFFFIADWHALTTHYAEPQHIYKHSIEMAIDWLAIGIDPEQSTLFIQSQIMQHAELHVLLSMVTPLSWLERVPSYKDQQEKLKDKDLSTYGFLGYPLLQSADIIIYGAELVPVGEDQVAHVELTREVARRFNHLYGKLDENFIQALINKLEKSRQKEFARYKRQYQEEGKAEALEKGFKLIGFQEILSEQEKSLLKSYLQGQGQMILVEPQALLTKDSKMPGIDGQKMSKSYQNTISLREDIDSFSKKIKTMPTDPARVKRDDPGDVEKCPVWQWHQVYSSQETKNWVIEGCKTAGIGCIECKTPIIEAVALELKPIQEKIKLYQEDKGQVLEILKQGAEKAHIVAEETMVKVRKAIRLRG